MIVRLHFWSLFFVNLLAKELALGRGWLFSLFTKAFPVIHLQNKQHAKINLRFHFAHYF